MAEQLSHKRIIINATAATAQVIVIGVSYLFLYIYLLRTLGESQLGVYTLVLSTSSIASLANFGITSSLVKFVADYRLKSDPEDLNRLIFTSLISLIALFSVLIMVAYAFGWFIIEHVVAIDKDYVQLALKILPYSLLCLFINELGGVFISILEGSQRNYIRNIIYIINNLIFLVLTFFFVPVYGLVGVAYAQVIQSTLITLCGFFTGKSLLKDFSLFKWNWDKTIFKEIIAYGSKFQVVSIFQMLYEPATKTLLTKFAGLPAVAYYDMATRLVNQLRGLIANANQVLIPVIAHAAQNHIEEVRFLYKKALSITLTANIFLISAILGFGSLISFFWIGHNEPRFIFPLCVLSISLFINILSGPAFFCSLGEGKLNLLVMINFFIALANITGGILLGFLYGGKGVIVSWGISYAAGSLALIILYQNNIKVKFRDVFSLREEGVFFGVSLIYSAVSVYIFNKFDIEYNLKTLLISVGIYLVIFIPNIFLNKNLKIITRKLVLRNTTKE
ncbi:hypothetical protein EON78_00790 [bacterium]|nr:MAG: hypothetical protein EON78_00790 [bacterium]